MGAVCVLVQVGGDDGAADSDADADADADDGLAIIISITPARQRQQPPPLPFAAQVHNARALSVTPPSPARPKNM